MLIARTQQESDLFVEQELSHIVCLNKKPTTVVFNNFTCLVDNENQKLVYFPERKEQQVIKTKKYGSLVLFDRIGDFLDSRYNKSVISVYCNSESFVKRKRTTNKIVSLGSEFETYVFEDREFGNSGSMFMNEISGIEKQNGYLVVLERNKNTSNGCQIIDNFKLKGNG